LFEVTILCPNEIPDIAREKREIQVEEGVTFIFSISSEINVVLVPIDMILSVFCVIKL
jgi:hypothetical protein